MDGGIPSRRIIIAAAILAPFGAAAEAADFVGPLTPQQRQQRVLIVDELRPRPSSTAIRLSRRPMATKMDIPIGGRTMNSAK